MAPKRAPPQQTANGQLAKRQTLQPDHGGAAAQYTGVPPGWRDCPPMGNALGLFIPIKVPLGSKYNEHVPEKYRWTPRDVMEECRIRDYKPYMVVDLTFSERYYDPDEFYECGQVYHHKIKCRGFGQAPEPEAVNKFMWMMFTLMGMIGRGEVQDNRMVLVHCTHGFNRTGYMLVHALMRLSAAEMTVEEAVVKFAKVRTPGIYKDDYINQLFKYFHERRPSMLRTPQVPLWKGVDDDDDDGQGNDGEEPPPAEMHHDDTIGEYIEEAEAQRIRELCALAAGTGNPNNFPGSQPVSLALSNIELLKERRYYVTWKADGTRYLLALMREGVYLVDRSNNVRRVQMRFPTRLTSDMRTRYRPVPGRPPPVVGPVHNCTVLDGEMVVDDNFETGVQTRRFLPYDMIMLKGESLADKEFKERFDLIQREVMDPRAAEKHTILTKHTSRYQYDAEPFHVRRKDFWPLTLAGKVLGGFMEGLPHESDGLILQGWHDAYKPGTCNELLKWKFAHMNSVDFKYIHDGQGGRLQLLETRRDKGRRGLVDLEGGRVTFPQEVTPADYHNKIIECTWNSEEGHWMYMRDRKDKDMPNAYHVYEKVMISIQDNITSEVLLGEVTDALHTPHYQRDLARVQQAGQGGQAQTHALAQGQEQGAVQGIGHVHGQGEGEGHAQVDGEAEGQGQE